MFKEFNEANTVKYSDAKRKDHFSGSSNLLKKASNLETD